MSDLIRIRKVTSDGIYHDNSNGNNLFLSFKQCNENWLAYRKKTEHLSDEQVKNLSIRDKTVGQRNVDANKIFIEFFVKPFMKFEFIMPEQKSEYENLRNLIWEFGWSTNDLS